MNLIKLISSVSMVLVIALAIFMAPSMATNTGTVTRSLLTMAAPGATINVFLTPGATLPTSGNWFVYETIPAGFTYVSTTANNHSSVGNVQTFTLNGGSTFTYTVTVSAAAGTYTFSGTFVDADQGTGTVSGQNLITVQGQINIVDTYLPPGATPAERKAGVIRAMDDYFDNGLLTKSELLGVLDRYFEG